MFSFLSLGVSEPHFCSDDDLISSRKDLSFNYLVFEGNYSYNALDGAVPRSVVNHPVNYVDDDGVTHTNTIKGYGTGINRAFYGTHHCYKRKWINFYVAEACYKYNERDNDDMFGTL